MLKKRKRLPILLSIPLFGALAFFGPSSFEGWKSACGCIPKDWEFVISLSLDKDGSLLSHETAGTPFSASMDLDKLDSDKVASAFLRKVPLGSNLQEVKETSRFMESTCEEVNARLYRCDYWLQFKRTSARGYSVWFHLSETHQLRSLEAKAVTKLTTTAL